MPWLDSITDPETRAYAAGKGWDRVDGDAAALSMFKAYQNLEKVRPAAPPASAAEYVFEGEHAPKFIETARNTALALKMPVDAAKQMVAAFAGYNKETTDAATLLAQQTLQQSSEKLKTTWGTDYDTKAAVATRGLEALGLTKEVTDAIGARLGVDKLMETAYDLGSKLGEAPMLKGSPTLTDTTPAMTRGQALAERNKLTSDPEFAAKIMAGDAEATKKLTDVSKAIVGTPDNWQAAPANFGREHDDQGKEKAVDYSRYDVKPAA